MSIHALDFFAILAVPKARRDPARRWDEHAAAGGDARETPIRGGAFDAVELLQDGPEDTAANQHP